MTGDRAWVAPEMTPAVDAPDPDEAPLDRRGVTDPAVPSPEPAAPGEVPGIGGHVEGRSRLGTTSGADQTDEGGGAERPEDPA